MSSFNSKFKILFIQISNNGLAPSATNYGHYGHCFVPLASALDLQNQGYGSSNSFQSNNMYYAIDNNIQNPGQLAGNSLNPASLSPFNNILTYTSDCGVITCESYCGDDPYISINNINALEYNNWNDWHEGDISNQAQLFAQRKILNTATVSPCSNTSDFCNTSFSIIGSPMICTGTGTYQLVGTYAPNNINIQWSISNGTLKIINGQGTTVITVQYIAAGSTQINVVLTNSCGGQSIPAPLNVTVGLPIINPSTYNNNNGTITSLIAIIPRQPVVYNLACDDRQIQTNMQISGASSVVWSLSSTTSHYLSWGQTGQNLSFYFVDVVPQTATFNISTSNSCGQTNLNYAFQTENCTGGIPLIVISPNPISGKMQTGNSPEQEQTMSNNPVLLYPNPSNGRFNLKFNSNLNNYFMVKIFDANGHLVNGNIISGSVKSPAYYGLIYNRVIPVDISYMPAGIYHVNVYYNDGARTDQKTFKIIVIHNN